MGVEIERKFIIKDLPEDLDKYPFHVIEQGYLNVRPAIRVRREDDIYYMTYKSDMSDEVRKELLAELPDGSSPGDCIGKIEYNMPMDAVSYDHMILKADGNIVKKKRYLIPLNEDAFTRDYLGGRPEIEELLKEGRIKIELDVFDEPYKGMVVAEVEFPDEEAAANYKKAAWFGEEVTGDPKYSNAYLSSLPEDIIRNTKW